MTRRDTTERPSPFLLIAAVAVVAAACGNPSPTQRPAPSGAASPGSVASGTPLAGSLTDEPSANPPATIPQPAPPSGLTLAPESARVDLAMPVFSNPTTITNPLFPVSSQASVLMLGHVDNKPFRTEVTLLPYTRIIEWQGLRVESVVSQYNAYLDGRITELAYDYYAQADDGAVWYFGEDVFDFVDGAIVTTEGTWLAGKDAPAAMIMPGQPTVGDVYRPENAPGFVFEEVTVQAVDEQLDGPLGPITGGLVAHELHADGGTEDKIFAPGYGEFLTGGNGDIEALALAVPTDALSDPLPADLRALTGAAVRIFAPAEAGDWSKAGDEVAAIESAWGTVRTGAIPAPLEPLMTAAVANLADAVDARDVAGAQGASIQVARLAYDLQLRHRPSTEVDLARFGLWAAQILVDAAAGDAAGVSADVFALDYTRDRFERTLDPAAAVELNTLLGELQAAVIDDDLEASAKAAAGLREVVHGLLPSG
jgi:hypothetical protein